MSIQTAAAIIQRLGPGRIALDQPAHAELARELALMGCALADLSAPGSTTPGQGKTTGFLGWTAPETGDAFAAAIRPFAAMDTLVLQTAGQVRHGIEQTLFDAGWQRHPAGMMAGEYGGWSAYTLPAITYYQRADGRGGSELQQGGAEADALIARYAMAANQVRPGDHVLIDGAGSASGAAILSALSRAGTIDQAGEGIEADLAQIGDNSIDMIVAFEPSVPVDWIARLDDYARILKFDGRLVLGWRRSAGDNARPRSWDMLLEAASEQFLPETRYLQIPVSADPGGAHALFPVPLEQTGDTDWLLLVASANPLTGEGRGAEFDHPAFPKARGPQPALVDFGAAYDNPYLYRSMVQMGERLGHELKLARLAECVIEDSRIDSADRGAAIAVLGYRVLEMRLANLAAPILPLIDAYVNAPGDNAPVHVRRWRLSLAFLAGRLTELTGDRAAARKWYRMAATAPWADFSPLLATKSIAASFYEARLALADGDMATARACFRSGVETALEATAGAHREQLGDVGRPLPFYLQELAEVVDMGSQCANALAHFGLWERDPGLFWRQVDVRRFGLASWARDLEHENERLRAA